MSIFWQDLLGAPQIVVGSLLVLFFVRCDISQYFLLFTQELILLLVVEGLLVIDVLNSALHNNHNFNFFHIQTP